MKLHVVVHVCGSYLRTRANTLLSVLKHVKSFEEVLKVPSVVCGYKFVLQLTSTKI